MLARDRVRFAGEEIAVVVAETRAQARDAADLIEVEFEDLPAIIGSAKAMAPRRSSRCTTSIPAIICFDFEYGDGQSRRGCLIARAGMSVTLTIESPRVAPNADGGAQRARRLRRSKRKLRDLLQPEPGRVRHAAMRSSAMMQHPARKDPRTMVDVGGAFGARTAPFSEYPVLMYLAKKLKRPVKWSSTRSEDFLTDNHGRAIRLEGRAGIRRERPLPAPCEPSGCAIPGPICRKPAFLPTRFNGLTIGAGAYQVEASMAAIAR